MMNTHPKVVEAKSKVHLLLQLLFIVREGDSRQGRRTGKPCHVESPKRGRGIDRARRAESVANVNLSSPKAFRR